MKLPKLHLRDLFWLVIVAAMGCAWGVEKYSQLSLRRQNSLQKYQIHSLSDEFEHRTGAVVSLHDSGITVTFPDGLVIVDALYND